MKTSKLIKHLEDIMKINGDIDIVTNYDGSEMELLQEERLRVTVVYSNPYDTSFNYYNEKNESTTPNTVLLI